MRIREGGDEVRTKLDNQLDLQINGIQSRPMQGVDRLVGSRHGSVVTPNRWTDTYANHGPC